MVSAIYWDPDPEIFNVPFLNFPILWYGVFFAFGFWVAFILFVRVLMRYFSLSSFEDSSQQCANTVLWKKKAHEIADRLTVYVVIGTIFGARLGHFLFYERPSEYLVDPLEFFRFRNGGLASHGAALGIILAVIVFSYRIRKKYPDLTWVRILDFISPAAAFAGCCIRVGNFFNQEILGNPSSLPWAVVFCHPADGSLPVPRHPAQLYEALWYLAVFFILWRFSQRPAFLFSRGKLVGLFLISVFTFRFAIEFLKPEQSRLLFAPMFTMGQILSIPVIALGIFFYFSGAKRGFAP